MGDPLTAAPGSEPSDHRAAVDEPVDARRVVAAVDCGTNSTRLLVAERNADGSVRTLERLMRITRLGRGVDATGELEPDAVERTVEVLREYREVMDRLGVAPDSGSVRMTATSAARDAANREDFFTAAEAALGVRPELISGTEEAELSFRGATAELDAERGPFLVVDIGGGSTEFSYGTTRSEAAISLDMGCVRLTEKFLLHDPPLPEELSNCLQVVEVYLDDVARAIPDLDHVRTFVGLAGTVSTTAAVEIGLHEYDRDRIHHFRLTKPAVEDVFRTLATETIEERKDNPGMEAQRADVIVGGLCVLVGLMRRFGFHECLVSEADILDGLAMSVLDRTVGS
jgi:exopolyphosphatase/guanosine-5'-triphosphate,3'-diphosphate pyrophosphatase